MHSPFAITANCSLVNCRRASLGCCSVPINSRTVNSLYHACMYSILSAVHPDFGAVHPGVYTHTFNSVIQLTVHAELKQNLLAVSMKLSVY